MDYIGIKQSAFKTMLKNKLPMRFENGHYYAHKDSIDTFVKKWTESTK
jgi:hypothetical protein